jgi:hypothetical protein
MPLHQTWTQRERRYAPDRPSAVRVLATIATRLPAVVYDPEATINLVVTTYFDTDDRHYLAMADASGGRRSVRIRVREYLSSPGIGSPYHYQPVCFFERKERDGDVRRKQRVEVPKSQVSAILRHRRLPDHSEEADAISAEMAAHRLAPVMVSAYERRIFGTQKGLRVTYDERLSYHFPPEGLYDAAPALQPSVLGRPAASGPARILEVKFPPTASMPTWLEILFTGVPTAEEFSKFRDGMHALDDSDGPAHLTRPITLSELE